MSTPVEVLCKVNQHHHYRHRYHHHCCRHHHHVHSCRSALQLHSSLAFYSVFRPWSLVTGQYCFLKMRFSNVCLANFSKAFWSRILFVALARPHIPFLPFRRDQNSWKFAFWRRFWHGAVEHCSMVLHWSSGARHLRKFACGPAVSRSATNFRNIRAPQHRPNGVCNLCLGEPPVITTVFSTKGCFKRTISNSPYATDQLVAKISFGLPPFFLAERLSNCTFLDI